jgi:hypothetical protein
MKTEVQISDKALVDQFIDERFDHINRKFIFWEMNLSMETRNLEWRHYSMRQKLNLAICTHPSYVMGSLHSFLTDFVGPEYCENYGPADWARQKEIEKLRK